MTPDHGLAPRATRTLDLAEAAALLKVHPKTLQSLARAGHLPAIKVGRVKRHQELTP
jgi:excisionase family DNA binding protein